MTSVGMPQCYEGARQGARFPWKLRSRAAMNADCTPWKREAVLPVTENSAGKRASCGAVSHPPPNVWNARDCRAETAHLGSDFLARMLHCEPHYWSAASCRSFRKQDCHATMFCWHWNPLLSPSLHRQMQACSFWAMQNLKALHDRWSCGHKTPHAHNQSGESPNG